MLVLVLVLVLLVLVLVLVLNLPTFTALAHRIIVPLACCTWKGLKFTVIPNTASLSLFFLTKKEPKTVTRRERVVCITNKIVEN